MSTPKDGGPAFPSDEACASWQCRKPSSGMSLLDWFAGQALAGWLASYGPEVDHPSFNESSPHAPQTIAKASYKLAEAMITEREKRMNLNQ